jgi:hypothetical protein
MYLRISILATRLWWVTGYFKQSIRTVRSCFHVAEPSMNIIQMRTENWRLNKTCRFNTGESCLQWRGFHPHSEYVGCCTVRMFHNRLVKGRQGDELSSTPCYCSPGIPMSSHAQKSGLLSTVTNIWWSNSRNLGYGVDFWQSFVKPISVRHFTEYAHVGYSVFCSAPTKLAPFSSNTTFNISKKSWIRWPAADIDIYSKPGLWRNQKVLWERIICQRSRSHSEPSKYNPRSYYLFKYYPIY